MKVLRTVVVALMVLMLASGCGYKLIKKDAPTKVIAPVHQGNSTITIKGKEVEKEDLESVVAQLQELYGSPTATFQGFQEDGDTVILKVLHFDTGDDYEVLVHVLNGEVKTIFSNLK